MIKPTIRDAYTLLHQGMIAFSQMESSGIRIDTEHLERESARIKGEIRELEASLRSDEIFSIWRRKFGSKTNLGSRAQLGQILFNVLKHPSVGETATGKPRTDSDAFEHLEDVPFVSSFLKVEKLKRVDGTFLNGIRKELVDGFIHPSFNLHLVSSYRGSCDSPNLQQIPARDIMMSDPVRRCIIPRKGRQILEVDFSGIEVRVAYCYHKDPVMKKYLLDTTTDMHRDIAMQLFGLKEDQVEKKSTRDWAKNRMVFPQFYGSVYFQCAPHIWKVASKEQFKLPNSEISVFEHLKSQGIETLGKCNPKQKPVKGTFEHRVKQVEDSMWQERFKGYTQWKQNWWRDYLKTGGFDYYTGFRVEGIYERNQVLNLAIQGSAFHCLLWSLVRIQKWLRKHKFKTKIVGEIHDSTIFDVYPPEMQDVLAKVKQITTIDLLKHWNWIIIPMQIEAEAAEIDRSWAEKKGIKLP